MTISGVKSGYPTGNVLQDPGENLIKNLSRIFQDF